MNKLAIRDPFTKLVSRMFDDTLPRPFEWDFSWPFELEEGLLPLDISQTDGELVVRASLPGFTKEDIEVQVHQGILSIKAEQKGEEETQGEHFYRRERRMTSLSRRVALPGIVSEAETHAELKDGVLTLRIPVSEEAKPKRVLIE